jgi:hypothetical protein
VFQPKINDSSGGNDASGNTYIYVFVLGEEQVNQVDITQFIDSWRTINRLSEEPFVRSGKLLTTFHEMVKQQPRNKNVVLKSTKAMTADVMTVDGWKITPVGEAMDTLIRERSRQILSMKHSIDQTNERVFKVPSNLLTWSHLEQFKKYGRDHHGVGSQTREFRSSLKVAMLN